MPEIPQEVLKKKTMSDTKQQEREILQALGWHAVSHKQHPDNEWHTFPQCFHLLRPSEENRFAVPLACRAAKSESAVSDASGF
jgi:hypothetical protein